MPKKKPTEPVIPTKIGPASLFTYTQAELLAQRAQRQLLKVAAAIRESNKEPP